MMLTTFLNLVVLISVTKLLHLMVSEVKILQECGKAGKLSLYCHQFSVASNLVFSSLMPSPVAAETKKTCLPE